jgi:hypothetical protein
MALRNTSAAPADRLAEAVGADVFTVVAGDLESVLRTIARVQAALLAAGSTEQLRLKRAAAEVQLCINDLSR